MTIATGLGSAFWLGGGTGDAGAGSTIVVAAGAAGPRASSEVSQARQEPTPEEQAFLLEDGSSF
ncbi:hypothetical protein GW813_10900 [bacterium]|nr:hypothetical protein [bacterium]